MMKVNKKRAKNDNNCSLEIIDDELNFALQWYEEKWWVSFVVIDDERKKEYWNVARRDDISEKCHYAPIETKIQALLAAANDYHQYLCNKQSA